MSTQFFLDETDIEALTKLMLRSQQLRRREALCIRIGIDPRRLGFIKDSSDYDFVIELINYLNEISNKEALCNLCCKELLPIFSQSEKYATILSEIAAKLNCNQRLSQNSTNSQQQTVLSSIPASRIGVNPFNQLAKNKLVTGSSIFGINISIVVAITGVLVFFGGGLIYYFTLQRQQDPLVVTKNPQTSGSFIRNSLSGKCLGTTNTIAPTNGDKLQLWDCEASGLNRENNSHTDQMWMVTTDGFIKNKLSGKCIDVVGAPGQDNGAELQLWDCEVSGLNRENNSGTDQMWTVTTDGFIKNKLSKKCITVVGAPGQLNSVKLQLWDCKVSGRNADNGSPTNQKWTTVPSKG